MYINVFVLINFILPIAVEPKKDDNNNKDVPDQSFIIKYNEDKARDVISHILIQYQDYSYEAQYKLFLTISKIGLSKQEFTNLCKSVKRELSEKYIENTALMEYHVDHVMSTEHVKMIDTLSEEVARYKMEWQKEAYKTTLDLNKIAKISRLMHISMKLLTEFNLGTNVILFIQKKMESLENKAKTLNIKDLNVADKYDDTNNIDNKVNALSLTETTTPTTTEADEEERRSENGGVIPKVRNDKSSNVQGSVLPANEEGSGGTQTETSERARGAVF